MPADGRWDLTRHLTLILPTWKIWWAPNNASRWQMGLNLLFKGLMKLEFSRQISEKHSDIKFNGNPFGWSHGDGRTDMKKLIVAFRKFANAPNNKLWTISTHKIVPYKKQPKVQPLINTKTSTKIFLSNMLLQPKNVQLYLITVHITTFSLCDLYCYMFRHFHVIIREFTTNALISYFFKKNYTSRK
jgi:hypothetical protein